MANVLVSFDGSTPHWISRSEKSRNMMDSEDSSPCVQSQSKSRLHPRVNLPFFRQARSKKTGKSKHDHKCEDSVNDGSTQETESNINYNISTEHLFRLPARERLLEAPSFLTPNLKLVRNDIILSKKAEIFNNTLHKDMMPKRSLINQFENTGVFDSNKLRVYNFEDHSNIAANNQHIIHAQKANIQRFMLLENFCNENPVSIQSLLTKKASSNIPNRIPWVSVPKERRLLNLNSQFKSKSFKIDNQALKEFVNNRNNHPEDLKMQDSKNSQRVQHELLSQSSHRRNNSMIADLETSLYASRQAHNNSQQIDHRTLEPDTPTVSSDQFKLPDLSRRSKRRKEMISKSSARKKLPGCFLLGEPRKARSKNRNGKTIQVLTRDVYSEQVSPRYPNEPEVDARQENTKMQLFFNAISKHDWNNTARFAPIINH